ncbi:hypothetical protein ILUMI_11304 [Ignelater luminosus]|uniref:Uncharacterized protein n=1 Tax=Ignelater luminosus TaxID=2038154 RepID=A0A8K0G7V4_IGNLU|nr:hypothetical protein ILUMI_11304 [Ignelater luminosus]
MSIRPKKQPNANEIQCAKRITDYDIKIAVKEKKLAYRACLGTGDVRKYTEYRGKQRIVKGMIKESNETMWTEFEEELAKNFNENQKLFYGKIMNMRKPR